MRHSPPDYSCRLRRKSTTLPIAILTGDLQGTSHRPSELRQRLRPQSGFGKHQEQLSAVAALQLKLAELAGPERALDLLAREALTVTNACGTAIAVALGEAVVCCARAGPLAPPLGTTLDTRSGLSGECFRSGEVVCCNDAETDARVDVEAHRKSGIRSALAVPLRRHEQVSGVFAVFSSRSGSFGHLETRVLQLLAGLASQLCITTAPQGSLPEITGATAVPFLVGTLPAQESTERENPPAAANGNALASESRIKVSSALPRASARRKQVSECLDRIRQDPALRLLGRAKAYLTIEALYDGTDRSQAVALLQELMFERAAAIGAGLNSTAL